MSRLGSTAPPIERMAYLARLLRDGQKFNASTVAQELEVDSRTIHRDIDFMRDRLGYTIEWTYFNDSKGDSDFQNGNGYFHGHPPKERIL